MTELKNRDSFEHGEGGSARTNTVWILLEHGADVTARIGHQRSTPLHLASSLGSPKIVQLLIKHGADVNALDGNREMPLHLAMVAEVRVKTA